jgi:hypothetical protein
MSLPARTSLAIALAWAGGFGSLAVPGWWRLAAAALVIAACVNLRRERLGPAPEPARALVLGRVVALAVCLGLLARTLGRVLVEVPAALWALPLVGAALMLRPARARGRVAAWLALPLALAAGLFGARFELGAPQARGAVFSGPIIGVHPRQATAVRIDGFGPHDIVVDDYVDPPGGLGYDPASWAERLELALRTIATTHYADGPARAREAFALAEVRLADAAVPPADLHLYESLLGVEVRSGTAGEGSRVEFVCPGQRVDPRGGAPQAIERACPRKYLVDGSAGLGLSRRFAGYTEVRGRDRLRLARVLGWPSGIARSDRRSLALESGLWLLALVLGAWALGRGRGRREQAWVAASLAGACALGLALLAASVEGSGSAAAAGASFGPALLALALILLPADRPSEERPDPLALPLAALLALLVASPLAGRGDGLDLHAAITKELVLGLDLPWSHARALAASAAVVVLAAGLGVCVAALVEVPIFGGEGEPAGSERRHTPMLRRLGLSLVVGVALALRKPGDDLALLCGVAALLIAGSVRLRGRAATAGLAVVCSLGAAIPLLFGVGPLGGAFSLVAALACLATAIWPHSPRPRT